MPLVYPGSAAIPQYESSLAAFMPAFEKGQAARKDSDAFNAAAKAFGGPGAPVPKEQNFLEKLLGIGQEQQQEPYTRPQPAQAPQNAVAAIDQAAPTGDMSGYIANARAAESGGNDTAANPNSSALGRYQFLESTWNGLAQQYPELGLTADGRTDPAQQERAMGQFTKDNASALTQAGVPVNPGSLYAAHFLGSGGATKALTAPPETPMSALVDPGVIQANPQLQGMTAGDFAEWANGKGGNQSGGYQPPMRDEGAGQGQPFTPDEGTMRTLLASEATRPLAISLIQAQQETQASRGRFVTEQGQDGSIWQRDTLTGAKTVLQQPNAGLPAGYRRGADGGLAAIPGGPADPANPLNANKSETFTTLTPEQVKAAGLSPGSYQQGSDGKITPLGPTSTDDQREYELAKSQGFPGTFLEFKTAQRANSGLSIKTNPDGTTEIIQGDLSGMPKLTEGQGKDVGYLTRGSGANDILSTLDTELTNFGSAVAGVVPGGNAVQSENYQKANQAGLEFLAALLRKDSGGAITPEENSVYGDIYLPRFGDKPGVIQQKREARQRALQAIELGLPATAIKSMEEQGIDLSGARLPAGAATPQTAPVAITDDAGFDALPSGAHFIGPDGQERVKP